MQINKVSLENKFKLFSDQWSPKVLGTLNNQAVKIAKLEGEFDMHHHENEDELFLVIEGYLRIEFDNQDPVELEAGEFVIVLKGQAHKPIADKGEVKVLLFEPETTLNTGNLRNERTKDSLDEI